MHQPLHESRPSTTNISGAFSTSEAQLQGPAVLKPVVNHVNGTIKLQDTLYVPGISHSLLSVPELCRKGCKVIFKGKLCKVYLNGKIILEGELQDNLFVAKTLCNKVIPKEKDIEYWHRVIGHVGQRRLLKILKHEGIETELQTLQTCEACIKGKMKRRPFKTNKDTRVFEKGQFLHMDLVGPIPPSSRLGNKYVLTVVDNATDKSWAIPLKKKSDAKDQIRRIIKFCETQTQNKVKAFRCDRGTEFSKAEFKS